MTKEQLRIQELENQLQKKDERINDLEERLKLSFKADKINKNQELITLKTDIAQALRLQYDDFEEFNEEPCNKDNYEVLKVTLKQIFRTLKRYGVKLGE